MEERELLEENKKLHLEVAHWQGEYNEEHRRRKSIQRERDRLNGLMYELIKLLHSCGFK